MFHELIGRERKEVFDEETKHLHKMKKFAVGKRRHSSGCTRVAMAVASPADPLAVSRAGAKGAATREWVAEDGVRLSQLAPYLALGTDRSFFMPTDMKQLEEIMKVDASNLDKFLEVTVGEIRKFYALEHGKEEFLPGYGSDSPLYLAFQDAFFGEMKSAICVEDDIIWVFDEATVEVEKEVKCRLVPLARSQYEDYLVARSKDGYSDYHFFRGCLFRIGRAPGLFKPPPNRGPTPVLKETCKEYLVEARKKHVDLFTKMINNMSGMWNYVNHLKNNKSENIPPYAWGLAYKFFDPKCPDDLSEETKRNRAFAFERSLKYGHDESLAMSMRPVLKAPLSVWWVQKKLYRINDRRVVTDISKLQLRYVDESAENKIDITQDALFFAVSIAFLRERGEIFLERLFEVYLLRKLRDERRDGLPGKDEDYVQEVFGNLFNKYAFKHNEDGTREKRVIFKQKEDGTRVKLRSANDYILKIKENCADLSRIIQFDFRDMNLNKIWEKRIMEHSDQQLVHQIVHVLRSLGVLEMQSFQHVMKEAARAIHVHSKFYEICLPIEDATSRKRKKQSDENLKHAQEIQKKGMEKVEQSGVDCGGPRENPREEELLSRARKLAKVAEVPDKEHLLKCYGDIDNLSRCIVVRGVGATVRTENLKPRRGTSVNDHGHKSSQTGTRSKQRSEHVLSMTLKNPDAEFSRFFGNGVALHCMCNSYVKEEKLMIVPLDLEHHKHCPDEITKRAIDWETCNVSLADGIEQLEIVAREIDRGILNLKLLEQKIADVTCGCNNARYLLLCKSISGRPPLRGVPGVGGVQHDYASFIPRSSDFPFFGNSVQVLPLELLGLRESTAILYKMGGSTGFFFPKRCGCTKDGQICNALSGTMYMRMRTGEMGARPTEENVCSDCFKKHYASSEGEWNECVLPQNIAFPGIHGKNVVLIIDGKWTPNLPQIRKKLLQN